MTDIYGQAATFWNFIKHSYFPLNFKAPNFGRVKGSHLSRGRRDATFGRRRGRYIWARRSAIYGVFKNEQKSLPSVKIILEQI
jgi:hypothetical protein